MDGRCIVYTVSREDLNKGFHICLVEELPSEEVSETGLNVLVSIVKENVDSMGVA